MSTWIYQAILLFVCVLVVREIVREKRFTMQLTAVLALVPLVLRLFMIK
jgi:uncharacterized membrane protein